MLGYQKSTAGLTPLFTLVNHGIKRARARDSGKASPALAPNPSPEPAFQQNPKHPGTTAEALGRGVDFWYPSMRLHGPGPQRCKPSKAGRTQPEPEPEPAPRELPKPKRSDEKKPPRKVALAERNSLSASGASRTQLERELLQCGNTAVFSAAAPGLQIASQLLA